MHEERTDTDKIRVVLSILGLDGHDFALKYISHLLKDGGMEVIYLGCFQTVESTVNTAVQEDADVIGLSCHSWEYLHYVPQLITAISKRNMSIPVVVGGGIFTENDESQLKDMGIAAVFRGGATAEDIIGSIKEQPEISPRVGKPQNE